MKVAVTGASGHVGANLVPELVRQGHQVRVLEHKNARGLYPTDVEKVQGDVRDEASLRRAFDGIEVVYHLAAKISIEGDLDGSVHETNVTGVRNAAEAALAKGVRRFVHFSSIHAFQQRPLDQPIDENRAFIRPEDRHSPAYDRSKSMGQGALKAVIAKGLDAVIVHPTAVLGPEDHGPSRMGRVLLDLFERRMPALIQGGFDWVDVRDVVRGAITAEQKGRTGEHYLLGGQWASVKELANLAGKITGVAAPKFATPLWLAAATAPFALAYGRITNSEPLFTPESVEALGANRNIVHSKAERELAHTPRPLSETLYAAYESFMRHGQLPLRSLRAV